LPAVIVPALAVNEYNVSDPLGVIVAFVQLWRVLFPAVGPRFPAVKYIGADPAKVVVATVDAAAAKVALEHVPKIVVVKVFCPVMLWAVSVVTMFAGPAPDPEAKETIDPYASVVTVVF